MKIPSHADAFQVLLLQAADEGRGPVLFGDSLARARQLAQPFMVGQVFPDVYFEFPLIGDPFMDVTVLLEQLDPGTRIDSPAAGDHAAMLDWYAVERKDNDGITCGFELDTKHEELPMAAVHFQPRQHLELVRPFCEAIGEPERADLYLGLQERMPQDWPLSFFGLFRGRPGSPMRVCGYLGSEERDACANDPAHLAHVFDEVGFSAYDDAMLEQVTTLMGITPGSVDFQFDIFPDGTIGDVFAIDTQFAIEQPEAVKESFDTGGAGRIMRQLQEWGAADERWHQGAQAAFARALPVEVEDAEGANGAEDDAERKDRFTFTLMPQWAKARWTNRVLQPSKLYLLGKTNLL